MVLQTRLYTFASLASRRAPSVLPLRSITSLASSSRSIRGGEFGGRYISTTSSLFKAAPTTTAPDAPSHDYEDKFPRNHKRLPEFNLTNKVILVSGAAQGLGLAMTEALLEAGATVYALDRLPPEDKSPDFGRMQKRAEEELGTSLHYRQIDVRDVPSLNQIVSEIGDKEGKINGLIAAAGIQQETSALDYTPEDANRMFAVNITGVFMTAQAAAKQMIRFNIGGSIVMIASMSAHVANRGLICPAYNASKAGVAQLARNLASEWGPEHGIRVNTISPGYIVTAMVEKLFQSFPERRDEWATQNMLARLSAPHEYRGAGSVFDV